MTISFRVMGRYIGLEWGLERDIGDILESFWVQPESRTAAARPVRRSRAAGCRQARRHGCCGGPVATAAVAPRACHTFAPVAIRGRRRQPRPRRVPVCIGAGGNGTREGGGAGVATSGCAAARQHRPRPRARVQFMGAASGGGLCGGGWGTCGRGVSAAARPRSIIPGRVGGRGRPYGRVRRGWQPAAVPCRPQPRRRASL